MPTTAAQLVVTSFPAAAGSSSGRTASYSASIRTMGQGEPARARMWQSGGRWFAHVLDVPAYIEVTGTSRASCLAELRKATGDDVDLIIEVIPVVVGVAEAAEIMGWDKRRVITYIDRGSFPEPIGTLASGRIWLREDVEDYADHWRAAHPQSPRQPPRTPNRKKQKLPQKPKKPKQVSAPA